MRSRITIDIDEANNPVVKIIHVESDDVRDRLVKRFLEGFGYESDANVHFEQKITPSGGITHTETVAIIRPGKKE